MAVVFVYGGVGTGGRPARLHRPRRDGPRPRVVRAAVLQPRQADHGRDRHHDLRRPGRDDRHDLRARLLAGDRPVRRERQPRGAVRHPLAGDPGLPQSVRRPGRCHVRHGDRPSVAAGAASSTASSRATTASSSSTSRCPCRCRCRCRQGVHRRQGFVIERATSWSPTTTWPSPKWSPSRPRRPASRSIRPRSSRSTCQRDFLWPKSVVDLADPVGRSSCCSPSRPSPRPVAGASAGARASRPSPDRMTRRFAPPAPSVEPRRRRSAAP